VENNLRDLGVRTVVIPDKADPGKARQAHEDRSRCCTIDHRTEINTLGWPPSPSSPWCVREYILYCMRARRRLESLWTPTT
jgi:hypothetical protein